MSNAHAPYAQWQDDAAEAGVVAASVEYILIDAPALLLEYGAPMPLIASAYDSGDLEVPALFAWAVDNPFAATVSTTGRLTASGSGDVEVSASVDGSTADPGTVTVFVRGLTLKSGSTRVALSERVKRSGAEEDVTTIYQKRGAVSVRVY